MKIAITHPFCWPYVGRGNERNIEELALYLTRRGHQVTTVSTKPGNAAVEETEYGRRILHASAAAGWLRRMRIEESHTFFFSAWRSLSSLKADVVHSWYFYDGLAADYLSSRTGHRAVLQVNGVPVPGVSCHRLLPPEGWLQREAARRADAVIVCSRFIQALAEERYGIRAQVIPPPVNLERYQLGSGPSDGRPTLLAVADFEVRRKGVRLLLQAFQRVKSEIPEVVLRAAGNISPETKAEVLRDLPEPVRAGVEFLGVRNSAEVARLYGEASVMVLPSMWEPSGTVLIESLSAGTPVVATRHGGIPEFGAADVGVLFDPKSEGEEPQNAGGLADALVEGLRLSRQEGIRARCRAHATHFSWPVLGPQIEQVYVSTS